MGMTIEECIEIWTYPTRYFPSQREEAVDFAIDTMRKYQKIKEILNYSDDFIYRDAEYRLNEIKEVLEDGNVD